MSQNDNDYDDLVKLGDTNSALEESLSFHYRADDELKDDVLQLRQKVARLARDLKRSISSQDQLQDYLQELIAYQELTRQLFPVRSTHETLDVLLNVSKEVFASDGSVVYLWSKQPPKWVQKQTMDLSPNLEAAIEHELQRGSILTPNETDAMVIPFFLDTHEGSLVVIPLVSGRRQIGVFISYLATSHLMYFRHHVNMFGMFGRATAIALENAFLFEKVRQLSIRDDLTSIYNSRYFRMFLNKACKKASGKSPVTVFFMDVDNFKSVNDNHGHLVGSRILTEVAAVVQGFAGDRYCAARYGGDEFVLAATGLDTKAAGELAEQIRFTMEVTDFNKNTDARINLTISIGVASYPINAHSAEDLLNYADLAMYQSKGKGKNCITIWQILTR